MLGWGWSWQTTIEFKTHVVCAEKETCSRLGTADADLVQNSAPQSRLGRGRRYSVASRSYLRGEGDRGGSATFCPGFALERCAAIRSLGVESAQWQRWRHSWRAERLVPALALLSAGRLGSTAVRAANLVRDGFNLGVGWVSGSSFRNHGWRTIQTQTVRGCDAGARPDSAPGNVSNGCPDSCGD